MKHFLVVTSINLYPFASSAYPHRMHSLLSDWNTFLLSMGILAHALEPKLSSERHWDYAHAVLRMEWPQPLIYEALYLVCMKHNLQLLPKEKEEYCWLGEYRFPYASMIYFSSQPHHSNVVCMELSVPFESPMIHNNAENIF